MAVGLGASTAIPVAAAMNWVRPHSGEGLFIRRI